MSKKIILIFLIILISLPGVFGMSGLVWAAKYKCECTSAAPSQIYDVNSYEECKTLCNEYCLSHGGLNKCTEIKEKQETKTEDTNLDNPLGTTSISSIIGRIIKAFLGIIGTISLIMFIYAGLMLLTSRGNSTQIQKGQQTIVWASLGILVVFASYAILKFVFSAFGL